MADDIVTRLREMATDRARYSTHYDGCDQWHIECAALSVCDEIERLSESLSNAMRLLALTKRDRDAWREDAHGG